MEGIQNAYSACVFTIGCGAPGGGIVAGVVSVGVSGVRVIGCVVTVFLRCWSRCPLAMAADGGGNGMMSLKVISSHDVRKPESIALYRVDNAGFHNMVWSNTMRCVIVASGGAYA